jgi:hypothetical protein
MIFGLIHYVIESQNQIVIILFNIDNVCNRNCTMWIIYVIIFKLSLQILIWCNAIDFELTKLCIFLYIWLWHFVIDFFIRKSCS